jgi:hypothetical protein
MGAKLSDGAGGELPQGDECFLVIGNAMEGDLQVFFGTGVIKNGIEDTFARVNMRRMRFSMYFRAFQWVSPGTSKCLFAGQAPGHPYDGIGD